MPHAIIPEKAIQRRLTRGIPENAYVSWELEEKLVKTEDHVQLRPIEQELALDFNLLRMKKIIGVQELNKPASGLSNPEISRRRRSAARLADIAKETEPWEYTTHPFDHEGNILFRAIIHDKDFAVRKRLNRAGCESCP